MTQKIDTSHWIDQREIANYLHDVRKHEPLSRLEESLLLKQIRSGDKSAKEKLIYANLRYVITVAKQYQNQGLTIEDLISEGNFGLLKAAERFNYEQDEVRFLSYAVWWIRQSILQALAEQARIVRLPLNQVGSLNKINKAFSRLEQEFERPPSAEELAEALEVPEEKIKESLSVSGRHVSMDAPLTTNEDGGTLMDVMSNNDAPKTDHVLMAESLQKEIERSLSTLTDKEREIIRLFFGIGMNHGLTLEEIGSKFNLTRERVRQIKEKAIRRLRHASRNKLLKSYLG